MQKTNKLYFVFSTIIMLPIGVAAAFINLVTLQVMSSVFAGYPHTVYVATYTPDGFLIWLHRLGFTGIIVLLLCFLFAIAALTFLFKIRKSNTINFILYTFGTLFFMTSLIWCVMPMFVLLRYGQA